MALSRKKQKRRAVIFRLLVPWLGILIASGDSLAASVAAAAAGFSSNRVLLAVRGEVGSSLVARATKCRDAEEA
jgi:hypothetical protein